MAVQSPHDGAVRPGCRSTLDDSSVATGAKNSMGNLLS
eukprot:SAG31_NODE_43317_length_267_cov_1.226190_1_plen_37_part_10